jgi:hypothetical protein
MIDTTGCQRVLRTNQATAPAAHFARPRLVAAAVQNHAESPSSDIWPEGRPNPLARVARAARIAVREVREPGEVPLPHLYWGRNSDRRRDAA